MDITPFNTASSVLVVDFAAHSQRRRRSASQAIERPVSVAQEDAAPDQLITDTNVRAAGAQSVSEHLAHAVGNPWTANPLTTLSFAAIAGFIAGALWKA